MSNGFLGVIFALMSAHQLFETVRALTTKRVRRITFRRHFALWDDDPPTYWLATIWHGIGAIGFAAMSLLVSDLQGPA